LARGLPLHADPQEGGAWQARGHAVPDRLCGCADDGLGWATTAIIGAGTAFIASPTGPYAIAASGAAIAVASKAVETGLFAVWDTSLNVWGVFWVADATCGVATTERGNSSIGVGFSGRSRTEEPSVHD
jgi:hypothetical protein